MNNFINSVCMQKLLRQVHGVDKNDLDFWKTNEKLDIHQNRSLMLYLLECC